MQLRHELVLYRPQALATITKAAEFPSDNKRSKHPKPGYYAAVLEGRSEPGGTTDCCQEVGIPETPARRRTHTRKSHTKTRMGVTFGVPDLHSTDQSRVQHSKNRKKKQPTRVICYVVEPVKPSELQDLTTRHPCTTVKCSCKTFAIALTWC